MRIAALVTLALLCTLAAEAGIVGKDIEYRADGVTLKGYVAYDDAKQGKRPGILVVHEWWGHNAYTRRRANMLAGLGYVGFAVDMFGEGKQAADAADAGRLSGEIFKNPAVMKARFMAALETLKQSHLVDTSRIGAVGYCFGGGVVLAMARQGADLQAVVSFHGMIGAGAPAAPGAIKGKILVCNGADDKFISAEDIAKLKQEMKAVKADMTFINYAGSLHAFTNPEATANGKKYNIPIAYNAAADTASWSDMRGFLTHAFKK